MIVFLIIFAFHYAHLQQSQKLFLYCFMTTHWARGLLVFPYLLVTQVQRPLTGGKEPTTLQRLESNLKWNMTRALLMKENLLNYVFFFVFVNTIILEASFCFFYHPSFFDFSSAKTDYFPSGFPFLCKRKYVWFPACGSGCFFCVSGSCWWCHWW